MRIIRFYLPAIIWILIVLFLCTLPGNDLPKDPMFEKIHMDKIVHVGLFACTVLLLCIGYYRQHGHISKLTFSVIAISAAFYGLAIEYIQKYWAVQRGFDMSDVAADIVGAVAWILAFKLIKKWFLKPKNA
jgi:fumarate reductase subunit D